jgi:hypothetical protein
MIRKRQPSWRKLTVLVILILVALFLASTAHTSPFARRLLLIAFVVLGYALIGLWLKRNAGALEAEDRERRARDTSRKPWYPVWWRPGLSSVQRHHLQVKHGDASLPQKENAK